MAESHSDFHGRSGPVLGVVVAMIVLSTIFVSLRMVSRTLIVRKVTLDDYFIVLAWAIAAGLSAAICWGSAWGLGRHEKHVPHDWQVGLRKANYVFSVLYQPSLMATKTSILAFYLTLPTQNRIFKWCCIGTLVVVNAGGLALGLFTIFQCRPPGAAFAVPIPKSGHCTDIITIYLSSTPLNLITDMAILFLPIPILTGMRLPKKQKIILIITFSFGAFVAVVDVVRIVYLQAAAITRLKEIYKSREHGREAVQIKTDFSWYASFSFMWSAIEVNVGIMCACVPGLKPLVSRFLPNLLRDRSDPSSRNNSDLSPNNVAKMKEEQRIPSLPMDSTIDSHMSQREEREAAEEEEDGPMGMMDFLTTPDMDELPSAKRTQTAMTNTSRHTQHAEHTLFDFVNMRGRKSLVHLTNRESVWPIAAVTVLFFLWGFEYGLLDVLNQQFQKVAHMSPGQGTGIHSAYFAGYFFGPPLVGRLALKQWGFKACFVIGLSIYACGTLIFWPAAVLSSMPAFVITNFIVAFGLSILEVAANPFIFLCGPAQYGEMRLNLSQGIQAIGSIVAPLIADRAFIQRTLHAPSLINTQWAYLGISLFTILLAVAYYYAPLPEATDEELEDAAERIDLANKAKIGNVGIVWITLAFGVFSQLCYVGGQEVNGTMFSTYLQAVAPQRSRPNFMAIAHTAFAVARFLAAGLGFWIKPRYLLLFFYAGAIIFDILAMNYQGGTGTAMIIMVFFFEGPLFSLIFGQSLRGMGRHTKTASVLITAAVGGGSVFSPISSHIANNGGRPMYALVIAVAAFAGGTVFPVMLNLHPFARKQVDPIKDATSPPDSRPSSTSSPTNRALDLLHIRKKPTTTKDSTSAEWTERKSDGA
jgi:fucose permease